MARIPLERRMHSRVELPCAIFFADGKEQPARFKTINVSDGGAFVAVPGDEAPRRGSRIAVRLLVPRSTSNTYMLEAFESQAKVIRHDVLRDGAEVGLGIEFDRRIDLGLDS